MVHFWGEKRSGGFDQGQIKLAMCYYVVLDDVEIARCVSGESGPL